MNRLRIAALALAVAFAAAAMGQNIVFLGDSNIWLAGDSCDNHQGWAAWLRDAMRPESCVSYARSGASWSHTDSTKANPEEDIAVLGDDNVIYNQVVRLRDAYRQGLQPAPDIIIAACGGNDAWFSHKRPMEFSKTVEEALAVPEDMLLSMPAGKVLSLSEAVIYDCLQLRQEFPAARIVLVTSTPMTKADPDVLEKVCDVIELTGMVMGIPVIRLDRPGGPISRQEELQAHVNTYDGVHTNETGAQKVGLHVAKQLRRILGE